MKKNPNKETIAAMEEADEMVKNSAKYKRYHTFSDLVKEVTSEYYPASSPAIWDELTEEEISSMLSSGERDIVAGHIFTQEEVDKRIRAKLSRK